MLEEEIHGQSGESIVVKPLKSNPKVSNTGLKGTDIGSIDKYCYTGGSANLLHIAICNL